MPPGVALAWAEGDVDFGHVRVLVGARGGKYPDGNSLLVRGSEETVLIDPSLSVAERHPELAPGVDRVIHSHVHEDHLAGSFGFPDVPWYAHSAFFVEPDDLLYLGEIDLSSFGPYYGDAWSDLEDFERTLDRVRELEARSMSQHLTRLEREGRVCQSEPDLWRALRG